MKMIRTFPQKGLTLLHCKNLMQCNKDVLSHLVALKRDRKITSIIHGGLFGSYEHIAIEYGFYDSLQGETRTLYERYRGRRPCISDCERTKFLHSLADQREQYGRMIVRKLVSANNEAPVVFYTPGLELLGPEVALQVNINKSVQYGDFVLLATTDKGRIADTYRSVHTNCHVQSPDPEK